MPCSNHPCLLKRLACVLQCCRMDTDESKMELASLIQQLFSSPNQSPPGFSFNLGLAKTCQQSSIPFLPTVLPILWSLTTNSSPLALFHCCELSEQKDSWEWARAQSRPSFSSTFSSTLGSYSCNMRLKSSANANSYLLCLIAQKQQEGKKKKISLMRLEAQEIAKKKSK